MSFSPISASARLIDGHTGSGRSITLPISTRSTSKRAKHETRLAVHALLTVVMEVLGTLLPTIAYLMPTYEPMVRALLIGCTVLAVRVPSVSSGYRCNAVRSREEAA